VTLVDYGLAARVVERALRYGGDDTPHRAQGQSRGQRAPRRG
jgi:hypothetical protein